MGSPVTIAKADFIKLRIIYLFHNLFNLILLLIIVIQMMEYYAGNLQELIVTLQVDICAQLIKI